MLGGLEVLKPSSLPPSSKKVWHSTEAEDRQNDFHRSAARLVSLFFLFGPFQTLHRQLVYHPRCDTSPHKEAVGFPHAVWAFLVISAAWGAWALSFDLSRSSLISPQTLLTPPPGRKCRNRGDAGGPKDLTWSSQLAPQVPQAFLGD